MQRGETAASICPAVAAVRFRHKQILDEDVVRSGPAHSKNVPSVLDLRVATAQGNREVQDDGLGLQRLVDRLRQEQIAERTAACEDLLGVYAPSAVDTLRRAGRIQPVRRATHDQHEPIIGNPPKKVLHGFWIAVPAPCSGCHGMGVHRQCERSGAAVVGERAQHRAQLGIRRAATAELAWNPRRKHASRLQLGEILGDERIGSIVSGSPRCKARAELVHQAWPVDALSGTR
jgi:hypothetical protein